GPGIQCLALAAPGRVLLVVESLPVRGGNLLGARPLLLGEQLLGVEVRPGVVVVELGEQVRWVRLGLGRGTSAMPPPARIPRRGRWGSAAGSGTRREPCPDRRLLACQRIVSLLQALHLRLGEPQLVPVEEDRRDGRPRQIRGREDVRRRGWRRGGGTGQAERWKEQRRTHARATTPAEPGRCGRREPGAGGLGGVGRMHRALRVLLAGSALALLWRPPAARA